MISVIVPMYNAEETIEKCVKSIQKSIYSELEIILVNDGSKDKTLDLCRKLQSKDERIRIINKVNSGAGESRTQGLKEARGEFVSFVDADDWVSIDMYSKMLARIERENADVCFCGYIDWDNKGNSVDNSILFPKTVYNENEIRSKIMHNCVCYTNRADENAIFATWTGLYRRRVIEENHIVFFNERECYSEDSLFNLYFLANAKICVFFKECLYYHTHGDSTLSTIYDERYKKVDVWYKYVEKFLQERCLEKEIGSYLKRTYLGEYEKRVNNIINSNVDEKNIFRRVHEVKKDYKYIDKINVWKLNGVSLRFKIKKSLLVNHINFYVKLKNRGIDERRI